MRTLRTLKTFSPVFILILALQSCATEAPVQEKMVIDPHMLVFMRGDSVKTVSITHTCSCPFTWTSSVLPVSAWLTVPASTSGDHTDIPFSIDRSKLLSDTSSAVVHIISNSYGTDSIVVVAYK